MTFENIDDGGIIYYAEIKDSTLVDGEIKIKSVADSRFYYATECKEFRFDDGTMIIPNIDSKLLIKNRQSIDNIDNKLNIKIYACDYETCMESLKSIISKRIEEVDKKSRFINEQLADLCIIDAKLSKLENSPMNKKVVVDAVYVD